MVFQNVGLLPHHYMVLFSIAMKISNLKPINYISVVKLIFQWSWNFVEVW